MDGTRRLLDLMASQPIMTKRLWQQAAFALVFLVFLATPSVAVPSAASRFFGPVPALEQAGPDSSGHPVIRIANEVKRPEPDIDMFASMAGKCGILKVAGRDFACRAVAYFHSQQGRANFTIVLDDPADNSHIISFSGDNARREQDNLYELTVDQMLLNSKDRPKADGIPVPSIEPSAGSCRMIGNFATGQVSSIACTATDKDDKKYELRFDSDGSQMKLMKLRQGPPKPKPRRTRKTEQFECRNKAYEAKVLPRDLTAFIIQCLADTSPSPAPDDHP
jgi:hypothetical protein